MDAYPGDVFEGKVNALNSKVDDATRNIQVQATIPNADERLMPGMFASVDVILPRRRTSFVTLPRDRDRLQSVRQRRLRGRADEGRAGRASRCVARQHFVSSARPGATRWRSSRASNAGRRGRDGRPAQAAQRLADHAVNNSVQPADQPSADPAEHLSPMNFTDIFIKRPVLATVVSLLILFVGLRSISLLNVRQYPVSNSAIVTVTTIYTGASADLIQGFITTPLEKQIASADGIDYIESSSAPGREHDHGPPDPQLRPERRGRPDHLQDRQGAQPAPARSAAADDRRAGGRDDGGDVPELLRATSSTTTRSPTT